VLASTTPRNALFCRDDGRSVDVGPPNSSRRTRKDPPPADRRWGGHTAYWSVPLPNDRPVRDVARRRSEGLGARPVSVRCDDSVMLRPPETEETRRMAIQLLDLFSQRVSAWWAGGDRDKTNPDTMSPDPGSSLARDDLDADPFHLSHAATSSMAVAVDHLHCLLQSVVGGAGTANITITTRPWALYSLLRGAVENAATAVWLLAPSERPERLERRVRLQLQDAKYADEINKLMDRTPDHLQRALVALEPIAEKAKYVMPRNGGSVPPSEVVRDAGASFDLGANGAMLTWRACSGIAHGDNWALVSLPSHEILNDPAGDIVNTRVTLDVGQLAAWTSNAVRMIEEARRLYALRRANHIG